VPLRERAHLIEDELPRVDGGLRHALDGLGAEHAEEGAIDVEQHERALTGYGFLLRLRVERRALYQRTGPAEIGEQLVEREAAGNPVVNDRIVQSAGRDAAARLGVGAAEAAVHRREIRG